MNRGPFKSSAPLHTETQHVGKGKGKGRALLCLIIQQTVKAYGGVEVQFHAYITAALDDDKWQAPRTDRPYGCFGEENTLSMRGLEH